VERLSQASARSKERDHVLTVRGRQLIADLGIDAEQVAATWRDLARC
jgi:pyruvate/2-oxoglutarate dehydrogenase complex dihydrolipoamide acyltransferase (E2) component